MTRPARPQPEAVTVLRRVLPWLEGARRHRGLALGLATLAAAAVMGVS